MTTKKIYRPPKGDNRTFEEVMIELDSLSPAELEKLAASDGSSAESIRLLIKNWKEGLLDDNNSWRK